MFSLVIGIFLLIIFLFILFRSLSGETYFSIKLTGAAILLFACLIASAYFIEKGMNQMDYNTKIESIR
jgi:hypothetical protein